MPPFVTRVKEVQARMKTGVFTARKIVMREDFGAVLDDLAKLAIDPEITHRELGKAVYLLTRALKSYLLDEGPRG